MADNPQVGIEVVGDWSQFDAEAAQRQNMKTTIGPTMGTEGRVLGGSPTSSLPPVEIPLANGYRMSQVPSASGSLDYNYYSPSGQQVGLIGGFRRPDGGLSIIDHKIGPEARGQGLGQLGVEALANALGMVHSGRSSEISSSANRMWNRMVEQGSAQPWVNPNTGETHFRAFGERGIVPFSGGAGPAAGGSGSGAAERSLGAFTAALEGAAAQLRRFSGEAVPGQRMLPGPGGSGLVRTGQSPYSFPGDEVIDAEWVAVQRAQLGWQGQPTLPPRRGLPPPPGGGSSGQSGWWSYGQGGGGGGGGNYGSGGPIYGPQNRPWYWGLGKVMSTPIMSPRMMFNVMFGLHEIAQTSQAVQDMEINAAYADTSEQALQARIQGIHTASRGIFSGIASMAWDYSPWSASGPRETIKVLESAQFQAHTTQRVGDILVQNRIMSASANASYQGSDSVKRAAIEGNAITQSRQVATELTRVSEQLSAGQMVRERMEDPQYTVFKDVYRYSIQGAERSGLLLKQNALRQSMAAIEATRVAGLAEQDRAAQAFTMGLTGRGALAGLTYASDRTKEIEHLTWQHAVEAVSADPERLGQISRVQEKEAKGLVDRLDLESHWTQREMERHTKTHILRARGADSEAIANADREARNFSALEKLRINAPELVGTFTALMGGEAAGDAEEWEAKRRHVTLGVINFTAATASDTRARRLAMRGGSLAARKSAIDDALQANLDAANKSENRAAASAAVEAAIENARSQKEEATQDWNNHLQLMNMAAATTTDILAARRARSPEAALAAETFGRARAEAVEFLQKHGQDPGARDIAVKSLENSKTMLDLQRRDYLESFRGQEINLTKLRVDNPRDQEDPSVVLGTIRSAMERIENLIQHIAD